MMTLRYKGDLANVIAVDCEGEGRQRAGGLACLWDNTLHVDIAFVSTNHIDMYIRMEHGGRLEGNGFL